jgi:hypothetical protein
MPQNKTFLIIILLVILSLAASYLHRFLVVDRDSDLNLPVITDTVIPATGPVAELTSS